MAERVDFDVWATEMMRRYGKDGGGDDGGSAGVREPRRPRPAPRSGAADPKEAVHAG